MAVHVTHLHLGARMDSTPGQGRLVLVIAQLTSAILRPFLDFFFFFLTSYQAGGSTKLASL